MLLILSTAQGKDGMKVTLDTNVFISGSFWVGDSYSILYLIDEGKVELVLSESIIQEYYETLQDEEIKEKIIDKKIVMLDIVEKTIAVATIVNPTMYFNVVPQDPDDNKILECAVEGKVDYIISQDNHLLKLKTFKNIPIITPKAFLERINK